MVYFVWWEYGHESGLIDFRSKEDAEKFLEQKFEGNCEGRFRVIKGIAVEVKPVKIVDRWEIQE